MSTIQTDHPCSVRCWRVGGPVHVPLDAPCPECGRPWPDTTGNVRERIPGASDKNPLTEEEKVLVIDALVYRANFLETGQSHLSYDDLLTMSEEVLQGWETRLPTREQLAKAAEYRALVQKLRGM